MHIRKFLFVLVGELVASANATRLYSRRFEWAPINFSDTKCSRGIIHFDDDFLQSHAYTQSDVTRKFLAFAYVFCLSTSPLYAQPEAGAGAISGTVEDPTGARVASAAVAIENDSTGQARSFLTSEAGFYSAQRLPIGVYSISVQKSGFKTLRREHVTVSVGSALQVDLRLELGTSTESITVSEEAPLLDARSTSIGNVVNDRAVHNLPINGRNFLDFTILAPGVIRDPARVGDLSFGGQRGPANSLLIDGMDANSTFWGQSTGRAGFRDPYAFSQDAVQEFQVLTNSFSPEIGRATGGVVNVITKSGTNSFHGTGFWFFRDRSMNANTFFNNKTGIARQPYHYNQFGGNLGGPIVKNKLFFFYNYDGMRNHLPNPVYLPVAPPSDAASQMGARLLQKYLTPYLTGLNNDVHTIKVDWLINLRHTVSARYNLHRFTGLNQEYATPQSALEHNGTTTLNTDNVTLAHTWSLSPNKLLDQRFLFLQDRNPSSSNGTGPEVVIRQSGITALQFGTVNALPRYTNQAKYGVIQTFNWTLGPHDLKMGMDLRFDRATNYAPTLFSGQYTFNSYADFANNNPASFAQALPKAGTSGAVTVPNANAYAFFVQDSWRATSRLSVNYGIRYDLFTYAGNNVRNPDQGLAALGLQTGVMPTDPRNVAGRLGLAYRLDAQGHFIIRAGAGTFYGPLPGLVNRTIQAQNGVQIKTFTLTGAAIPSYPNVLSSAPANGGAAPDIYVMQPGFKTARTHQWNFNLETQWGKDIAVTIGYLGVRGTDLTRVRDINLLPAVSNTAKYPNGTAAIFFRHPGVASPVRPNPNFGRISLVENGADSSYHGAFIQMVKRYANGFQLQGSYTFSKVIDTAPWNTSFIPNSASEDPNLVQDTLAPNADRAIGGANVTHRFVLSPVWDLPFGHGIAKPWVRSVVTGWQASSIVSLQSGTWFSATTNVDLNNDGNRYTDRSPGYGRNTIEGPGLATVDLRISKTFPLGREDWQLRLIGEAFNAFNRANFTTVQQTFANYDTASRTFIPNPGFLQPTGTADPRILQIAARLSF
jgi:outer membrane receptor protein involved in Fe transport